MSYFLQVLQQYVFVALVLWGLVNIVKYKLSSIQKTAFAPRPTPPPPSNHLKQFEGTPLESGQKKGQGTLLQKYKSTLLFEWSITFL